MLAAARGRPLAQIDLHVTLCFLGAVGEGAVAALCERAAEIDAATFDLAFERLEVWREARILAAPAANVPSAGSALASALAALARQLGLTPELRPWRPHITLARQVTQARLTVRPAGPLTLQPSHFYLAESQGLGAQVCGAAEPRRYATLAAWPLRPSTAAVGSGGRAAF